jgi:hypothetical protein
VEPSHLPPDLLEVERRLSGHRGVEPSPDHERRVLAAVRQALAAGRGRRARRTWEFAVAAAAGILLWMNLVMSAANLAAQTPPADRDGHEIRRAAADLRRLVPALSEQEAIRQAILLQAGSRLVMAPQPRPTPQWAQTLHDLKEAPRWVTP